MTPGQGVLAFDAPAGTSEDVYDPQSGLTRAEWTLCAQWAADHRRASNWIVLEAERINRPKSEGGEERSASWRQDIEPELAKHARQYGLDKGVYPGVDHNLSAPLARYYAVTRGLKFRTRVRARDNVKNASPATA